MSFGVYVHWPFCTRICPYCDFTVYRARSDGGDAMLDAIAADIAGHAARMGRRAADTVFLGGGTPSLLDGRGVARLLETVDSVFGFAPEAEITLEANPEDRERFADHAAAGVNRFSLGLQALDNGALSALGRAHTAQAGIDAVEAAAATGRRVSVDLIYGRHGQSLQDWEGELARALALPAEHFSLYELTVKEGTAFERAFARRRLKLPDEDGAVRFYARTQEICTAAGAPPYEISNYARTPAAQSRHNRIYWTGGDWIGVGPGASGRLRLGGVRTATRAHTGVQPYIHAVSTAGVGWESCEALDRGEIAEEALIMGLRLSEGVDRARIEALRGAPLDPGAVEMLVAQGLLAADGGRLRLTPSGRLVADRINLLLAEGSPVGHGP